MADFEINSSFTIDAAKILAKLHRAGCQTYADVSFFNSGVSGDQKGLAPEAVEKAGITFDTAAGEYELGVMTGKPIEVKLKHTADDIRDKAAAGKAEADSKAKITDNPDDKKVDEGIPSFMQFLGEDDPQKDGQKKDGEALVDPFVVPKDTPKEAEADVKKMVEENRAELQKAVDNAVKNAVQYLGAYMKVFAGEDESKKITEKSIVVVYLPEGASPDKFEYRDGLIQGLSDEERQKAWMEVLKKEPGTDKYVINGLCCKTAYTLSMES